MNTYLNRNLYLKYKSISLSCYREKMLKKFDKFDYKSLSTPYDPSVEN